MKKTYDLWVGYTQHDDEMMAGFLQAAFREKTDTEARVAATQAFLVHADKLRESASKLETLASLTADGLLTVSLESWTQKHVQVEADADVPIIETLVLDGILCDPLEDVDVGDIEPVTADTHVQHDDCDRDFGWRSFDHTDGLEFEEDGA